MAIKSGCVDQPTCKCRLIMPTREGESINKQRRRNMMLQNVNHAQLLGD